MASSPWQFPDFLFSSRSLPQRLCQTIFLHILFHGFFTHYFALLLGAPLLYAFFIYFPKRNMNTPYHITKNSQLHLFLHSGVVFPTPPLRKPDLKCWKYSETLALLPFCGRLQIPPCLQASVYPCFHPSHCTFFSQQWKDGLSSLICSKWHYGFFCSCFNL